MKKKILICMVLLLAAYALCAEEYEYPVLDKQVEIRQAHIEWVTTGLEISMDATVDYIDEISDGAGTSELSSLLSDFEEQTDSIGSLTTHVALNNALRQLKTILDDFRSETQKQMRENNGNSVQLLASIREALDENEKDLEKLEDGYWKTLEKNTLDMFDIFIERAQQVLDELEGHGYEITEAQDKLDEIKNKENELKSALKDRDYGEIRGVCDEIKDLSSELADIVRDLQVEVPKKKIIGYWIGVCSRAVDRSDTIIHELDSLGIDISGLRGIHTKAEADLEKADDAFDAGDLEGAVEALKDVKSDFIELRDAYNELIFGGGLPEDMEAKVESVSNVLENVIEEMDDSL